jgi:peptidoglycan pentaglycine glycine transferase (the first glycine)
MTGPQTYTPSPSQWDSFVRAHPDGHLLQQAGWGQLKDAFGWRSACLAVGKGGQILAGALLLYKPLPLRLGTMAYLPAGPLLAAESEINQCLWAGLHQHARRQRAAFLKAEPCNYYRPRPDLPAILTAEGFRPSIQTVQPPNTIVIDLSGTEDDILRRMSQSTRYKCRLGTKKEVEVRAGTASDLASFNALMQTTGQRDSFGVHGPAYYEAAYRLFAEASQVAMLIAAHKGQDLAAVMAFCCGPNAYYLYGASSNAERNRMPTYIVQWEAMRWAKAQGATRYDLWGVPDAEPASLEAQFETRHDGLWGVYGFKRGFGGQVVRSVGAWDKVYNPAIYAGYRWWLARQQKQAESQRPAPAAATQEATQD